MFDLELERVAKWIGDGGYSSVAVQLPEGLKIRAPEISEYITKNTGASVLIIGRPCYGACDLFDHRGWTDALVHYGHSRIPSMGDDPDVLYVEARSDAGLDGLTDEAISSLPERIGLLATIQYIDLIPKAKGILESRGKTVVWPTRARSSAATAPLRNPYPGTWTASCTSARATSIPSRPLWGRARPSWYSTP